MRSFVRPCVQLLLLAAIFVTSSRADDVLFVGNSFTFGAGNSTIQHNGGVPKLVEQIALAKGHVVTTSALTSPGVNWSYHLAQPATATALQSKVWTWVVLQDASVRPTRVGDIKQFLADGEIFSQRIAKNSPQAGILLYETWSRPPGGFYKNSPGKGFTGPVQMMADLHQAYEQMDEQLTADNPNRAARVALVGTAFAQCKLEHPDITVDASDHHHASAAGSYLAALVIYDTLYHDNSRGAPTQFFQGKLVYPADEAADLQQIADEVTKPPTAPGPVANGH